MVRDLGKLLNPDEFSYIPDDVFINFPVDIDGIHIVDDFGMCEVLKEAKKKQWIHKIFVIDEASQPPLPFYARGWNSKEQTELVTHMWQLDKKFCWLLYSDNLGNSIDVQLEDATDITIIPRYYHGVMNDRSDDRIYYRVGWLHDLVYRDFIFHNPAIVQKWFDSFRPVV